MNLRIAEMILYEENVKQEELEEKLKEYKSIKKYAGILHNKEEVKNHYHVMMKFSSPFDTKNLITMFKDYNLKETNISKIKGQYSDAVKYLIHKNAPQKYQYQKEQIFSNFDIQDDLDKSNEVNNVILQYSNLEISYNKLWKSLTPQQRMTYKRHIDRATEVRNTNIKVEGNRNMKVLYIEGPTGVGKTTLAKWICDEILEVDYYISSSSNDIMQDYLGQKAIILDDFRSDNLIFSDMLKFLDNHTQSTVKSRYYNKAIDCEYIIITTTQPLNEQYQEVKFEDRLQFYRRISELYCISNGTISFHQLDIEQSQLIKRLIIDEGYTLDITPNDIIMLYQISKKALPSVHSMLKKGIDNTYKKLEQKGNIENDKK